MSRTPSSICASPWSVQSSSSSPTISIPLTERSSTPSNISIVVTPSSMDSLLPPAREDISMVMAQVLERMDRVVEHLRAKEEREPANAIARNMIEIIKTFNETTAPWDIETSLMPHTFPNSRNLVTTASDPAPIPTDPVASVNSPSTWAAVAAVAPAQNNSIVKAIPQDAARMSVVVAKAKVDIIDPDRRVLWIRGWTESRPLGDVTKQIGQGPIYSMTFSAKDASVCLIFQYASSAKALAEDDDEYAKSNGRSRFGPDCDVMIGLPFPDNDDIRRMASPHNERRRLTFARQQLFTHGMTEAKFKADIYSIVGPSNVELVWLFNSGNATVVFSAVPLARMVRDEFIKFSRQPNSQYRDVHITFSHDPCERPMSLVRQMPAGRDFREGTYGGESALPIGVITKSASTTRRNARDSDGWQTVGRRH